MPSLSTADHRASPPRVDIPRDYNAAHDLVERNLRAGRAGKVAFIDDQGTYTYGELAARVDRCANALVGLGLQPEQRVLLCLTRHHRLSDGVPRRDQGGHRAGGRQHAVDDRRLRVHAARQPRAGAGRLRAAAARVRAALRHAAGPEARHCLRRPRRRRGTGPALARAAALDRRNRVRAGRDDLRRRLLLALLVGLDRRAEGNGAHAVEPDLDGRALREADPRHPRGRRRLLGGEAVLRLWPRQRPHVSDGGRRHGGADGRAAHARSGVRASREAPADDLLRRPHALRRRCWRAPICRRAAR